MKIKFPEYGNITEHPLNEGEMKFAVLKVINETAQKILIIFPQQLDHKIVVSNYIDGKKNVKFLGAGKADIVEQVADWGSIACRREAIEGGFGKEKPEDPAEADNLLAQVREKVKELSETLQEA